VPRVLKRALYTTRNNRLKLKTIEKTFQEVQNRLNINL